MQDQDTLLQHNQLFINLLRLLGMAEQAHVDNENAFLKAQLNMLRKRVPLEIIKTTPAERQILLGLGAKLGDRVRNSLAIVQYETYLGWIRNEYSFKPPKPYSKRGRKKLQDLRDIVLRIARENNWGYTRILGELFKLRLRPSKNTVKNILIENNLPIQPIRKNNIWAGFIKSHLHTLWACDFFTKEVFTPLGIKQFYVLFFINLKTRKIHIAGMSKNPDEEWVTQQVKGIIPHMVENKNGKVYLLRDRDKKYPGRMDKMLRKSGIIVKRLPPRSPNLNAYAESWVDKINNECLNYFMVFGANHLNYLITEYVKYHNTLRPHSGLGNQPLDYSPAKNTGKLQSQEILGGLHHHYYWA